MPDGQTRVDATGIGALALDALDTELRLDPKPGLVTPRDRGSHPDMDVHTFARSLSALRNYFPAIAAAGAVGASFAELQGLGIAAEQAMLAATAGVNTHRGAIFNLGLLCAAAGALAARSILLTPERVCAEVTARYAGGIRASAPDAAAALASTAGCRPAPSPEWLASPSHGVKMAARHGAGGARAEAANGFPTVRTIGLPAWQKARAAGMEPTAAGVQTLFALIAVVEDTNLLWRGGAAGLAFAQTRAAAFLARGGVSTPDWRRTADRIGQEFVAQRLSPGGSADLLGATLFLQRL
jgi:triphosphoribosyl-dephospho-CoA synthase